MTQGASWRNITKDIKVWARRGAMVGGAVAAVYLGSSLVTKNIYKLDYGWGAIETRQDGSRTVQTTPGFHIVGFWPGVNNAKTYDVREQMDYLVIDKDSTTTPGEAPVNTIIFSDGLPLQVSAGWTFKITDLHQYAVEHQDSNDQTPKEMLEREVNSAIIAALFEYGDGAPDSKTVRENRGAIEKSILDYLEKDTDIESRYGVDIRNVSLLQTSYPDDVNAKLIQNQMVVEQAQAELDAAEARKEAMAKGSEAYAERLEILRQQLPGASDEMLKDILVQLDLHDAMKQTGGTVIIYGGGGADDAPTIALPAATPTPAPTQTPDPYGGNP